MRIGYGRVSTRDQNPDGQRDALSAAGCEQILIDMTSGKLASRPALTRRSSWPAPAISWWLPSSAASAAPSTT